jgi:hypothetical protein
MGKTKRWATVAALVLVGCGTGEDAGDIADATCEAESPEVVGWQCR